MENEKTDIFISFKCTDVNGNPTLDSKIGELLHNALQEKGLNVFFSNETLRQQSTDEYMIAISNAIRDASVFILVATDKKYPDTKWVRKEWTSFLNKKLSSEDDFKMFNVIKDFSTKDLPSLLWDFQTFDYNKSSIDDIVDYITNNKDKRSYSIIDFLHEYYKQSYHDISELIKIYKSIIDNDDSPFYKRSLDYMLGVSMIRKYMDEGYEYLQKAYELGSIRAAYLLFELTKKLEYKKVGYKYYLDRFLDKDIMNKDLLIVYDNPFKLLDLSLKSAMSIYYHTTLYNYGVNFASYSSSLINQIGDYAYVVLCFSSLPSMKSFTKNPLFHLFTENSKKVNIIISGIKEHEIPRDYNCFAPYCIAEKRETIYRLSDKLVETMEDSRK